MPRAVITGCGIQVRKVGHWLSVIGCRLSCHRTPNTTHPLHAAMLGLALVVGMLVGAANAHAAISVQANANTAWINNPVVSNDLTTISFTPGKDGMLIATVVGEINPAGADAASVVAITWNGVALTKAVSALEASTRAFAHIYYLSNPAAGSGTLSVTLSNGSGGVWRWAIGAMYATGVGAVQSTNASTTATSTDLTSGPITATAGSLVVDAAGTAPGQFTGDGIVGGGDTLLYNISGGSSGGAASYLVSSSNGSYRARWYYAGGSSETFVAIAIAAFAPAGNPGLLWILLNTK